LGGYNYFLENQVLGRCLLRHRQRAGQEGCCQVLVSFGLNMGPYRMRHGAAARLWITLFSDFGFHC
jgi:hypothetical protein